MKIGEVLKKVFLIEIFKGLVLTLRMLLSKSVTIQYPFEKRKVHEGFRGRHALVRDSSTGTDKCIGCMRCSAVCPSRCIEIKREKRENKMVVVDYIIDASRCIYCAYCVETCPTCAIVLTEEYEYSSYSRDGLIFNKERMLRNWDEFAEKWEKDFYFNKFWQPPGIDPSKWPKTKREQGPIQLKYL